MHHHRSNISEFINSFPKLEVLVIGEAMLDSYLEGTSDRLCREAPVPLVRFSTRKDFPGGAANTAINVRRLGGRVKFLSVIGNDAEGKLLRDVLERGGVNLTHLLTDSGRRTIAKQRIVAQSQMLLRLDQGSTDAITYHTEERLTDELSRLYPHADAVIVSDYNCGLLTPRIIKVLT